MGAITFDLEPRSKVIQDFLSKMSKTMRDIDFICIIHIWEIIYGHSFGALTFDLEPRSKVIQAVLSNISKNMR